MQCEVYDTYVTKQDGTVMHFDVIVPVGSTYDQVLAFGQSYLTHVGQAGQPLTAQECKFCHIEIASPEVEAAIQRRGYYILALAGCPTRISDEVKQ